MIWIAASMLFSTPEINELNQKCYDAQADRWLRFPFQSVLPGWVKAYAVPGRALDIGSGNGILAGWLKENGFDVLCLDPSLEMVSRCRAKGLETVEGTIQEFEAQKTFSSVFAILSLIHVPKSEFPAQAEKIASLLPSGGTFFLALIEGSSEEVREQETGYPRFFSTFQKEEALGYFRPYFDLLEAMETASTNTSTPCLLFALKKK